ncbi:MAG: flagellar hook protein [Lachnospiraceae bacterium]|nr:flagellar hook protein [Lachnospiraceae bacterium]
MVVQHNLTAMNSNRMLGITQGQVSKSTEKLSSGYKINRAADDAAGLSISEKMRRQIRGLTQASANAQDGISAVQTAEGALGEVQDMLQRMDELATKAANGTMSETDRQNVQDEIDQLTTEIDRVSETTKFNETYLLKGSTNSKDGVYKKALNAKSAGINGTFTSTTNASVLNPDTKTSITTVSFKLTDEEVEKINNLEAGDTYDIGGVVYSIVAEGTNVGTSDNQIVADEDLQSNLLAKMTDALTRANAIGTVDGNATSTAGSVTGPTVSGTLDSEAEYTWTIQKATVSVQTPLSLSLHVGADSNATNKIDLQVEKMNARGLGVEGLKVTGTSAQNATFAIDAISDAINKVSEQRSALGAVQNRLEHTIKNVDNVIENTTAAESQIRDTDMATEMVKFSNNQILQQAGQSMLAQANQSNQGVLSILG